MKSFFFLLAIGSLSAQTPITFPKDGDVLNARGFIAKTDDNVDDTTAIQKALDAFPNGNRIACLPAAKAKPTSQDTRRYMRTSSGLLLRT